jgi:hypothetical protein
VSDGDDFEELDENDAVPARRSAVFPIVGMPASVAGTAGLVFLASTGLLVASGAIQAVSYRFPEPGPAFGLPAGRFAQPQLTAADRVQLFTRGAGLFPAVLVLLGAVCLVSAAWPDDGHRRRILAALALTGVLAAIVVVGNLALCVEVGTNAHGTIIVSDLANRFSSIAGLLAPALLAGGVLFYVVVYITSDADATVDSD